MHTLTTWSFILEMKLVNCQVNVGRVKSTGKKDLGLLEIKLQLLTPRRN